MKDYRVAVTVVLGAVTHRPESPHQFRRQRASSVDPHNQVTGLLDHHWTSAVSMVEPGPIVIRTP